MNNVVSTGKNFAKKHSFLCAILAVLSSQGIVVKCTPAIVFLTEDWGQKEKFARVSVFSLSFCQCRFFFSLPVVDLLLVDGS